MRHSQLKRDAQSGQSVLEYVLLLVVIAGLGGLIMAYMPQTFERLEAPIRKNFKYTYQYGAPDACGFGDTDPPCTGTPKNHIRYNTGGNFRMFGRGR